MLQYLIHRPIAVFMSLLAVLILSVVFVRDVPISMLPDIDIPRMVIQIDADDLDARSMENTIVRPIRNQLLQLTGLKNINSQSRNGSATIDISLAYGKDINLSFIEVNEKIDQLMYLLPRDLKRPRIIKTTVSDLPVYQIAVIPRDTSLITPLELSTFCENTISRRLEQLDEIAFVDMHGYAEAQILVSPDQALLQGLGIDIDLLAAAIQGANVELGNVILKDGSYEYNVRLSSKLTTIQDVENIIISANDQRYPLKALALVQTLPYRQRGAYLYENQDGISMTIRKQADANNFSLKDNMDLLLEEFEQDYPLVSFHIVDDQSSILKASFESLQSSLLYGMLFSVIIMFFFFREWRLALMIAVVVPVSLLISLLFFYIFDISINVISLSGLILGIGLMIDNAIITIENIRQFQLQHKPDDAVVLGSNEVIRPLISSALTTCSVFLPLILLSGLAGSLFYDQAFSVTIALLSSLLVSYFIIPVLVYTFIKPKPERATASHKTHHRLMDFIIRWRWIFILLFFAFIALTAVLIPSLKTQTFPEMTIRSVSLSIDWNEQISLQENKRRIKLLNTELMQDSIISSVSYGELQYQLSTATQNINEASIIYRIKPNSYDEVKQKIEAYLDHHYHDVNISISPAKNIVDQVFAQDQEQLILNISQQSSLELPDIDQISDIVTTLSDKGISAAIPPSAAYMSFSINDQLAATYRVSRNHIINQLRSLFNEYYTTELTSSEKYIPIYIGHQKDETIRSALKKTYVKNSNGKNIPLSAFVNVEQIEGYKVIEADRIGEKVSLPLGEYDQQKVNEIRSMMKKLPQLSYRFTGQHFIDDQLITDLSRILLVVLALLYLILAAQFESFIQPFIVILDVPVSIAGSILTLWFFDQSLNLVSLVGIIITAGIVINDSILKVELINQKRKAGSSLSEAIRYSSQRRLRPIIMTSLTTLLALTPLLFSSGLGVELQLPMVYAVMGGLFIGTFASLIFIPALYAIFYWKLDSKRAAEL